MKRIRSKTRPAYEPANKKSKTPSQMQASAHISLGFLWQPKRVIGEAACDIGTASPSGIGPRPVWVPPKQKRQKKNREPRRRRRRASCSRRACRRSRSGRNHTWIQQLQWQAQYAGTLHRQAHTVAGTDRRYKSRHSAQRHRKRGSMHVQPAGWVH